MTLLMLIASVPSLRHAIQAVAPELESHYMTPTHLNWPLRLTLHTPVFLGKPPPVLAASAEFRAALRLIRILALIEVLLIIGIVTGTALS